MREKGRRAFLPLERISKFKGIEMKKGILILTSGILSILSIFFTAPAILNADTQDSETYDANICLHYEYSNSADWDTGHDATDATTVDSEMISGFEMQGDSGDFVFERGIAFFDTAYFQLAAADEDMTIDNITIEFWTDAQDPDIGIDYPPQTFRFFYVYKASVTDWDDTDWYDITNWVTGDQLKSYTISNSTPADTSIGAFSLDVEDAESYSMEYETGMVAPWAWDEGDTFIAIGYIVNYDYTDYEPTPWVENTDFWTSFQGDEFGSIYDKGPEITFYWTIADAEGPGPSSYTKWTDYLPPVSQWIDDGISTIQGAGSGMAWLAMIGLMVIPAVYFRKKLWLVVASCTLILGVFLALQLIDMWIVLLLAIVAGGIVFLIIRKGVSGGGE